jgi:hypothetical protein
MRALAALAAALTVLCSGCGYHTAGHADLMPKTVKTIAIPAFGNSTTRYKLARLLPADLTREFLTRTRYRIVADPNGADAELTGSLDTFTAYPTNSDPKTGRATAAEVVANVSITLKDLRTGATLFSREGRKGNGMEFRDRYEVVLDPKAYFDESGTAIERVSRDVARTVVSAILEAF